MARDDDDNDRPAEDRPPDRDNDYDDRPSEGGKKKAKSNMGLIIGLAAGGGLLLVALAVTAFFVFVFDTPERAFEDMKQASLDKDAGKVYDRMTKERQANLDKMFQTMVEKDPDLATHKGKKGKDLFVAINKEQMEKANKPSGLGQKIDDERKEAEAKRREDMKKAKVTKVETTGDTATMTITNGDGKEEKVKLVKEDGRWRFSGRADEP